MTPHGRATAGPIAVVGLVGGVAYGADADHALGSAGVVIGSRRHLDQVTLDDRAEQVELAGPLDAVLDKIAARTEAGVAVCVLASGDPGFFGIVRVLGERFGPSALTVHPAPSSISLAFARLGRSWDDATIVSVHGRPVAPALPIIAQSAKTAVLTSPDNPPEALGTALLAAAATERTVAVVSRLGEPGEAITHTDLAGLADGTFDPLSVVILLAAEPPADGGPTGPTLARAEGPLGAAVSRSEGPLGPVSRSEGPLGPVSRSEGPLGPGGWGLPESSFDHRDAMITKAEVRAVVLGKLALPATGVLWDVGAGSGSVAVECARLAPGLEVIAVERDADQVARIEANAATHGVNIRVVEGTAPQAMAALPDPDRVFIGGGGIDVLDAALARLLPGGVVVATYALLARAVDAERRLGNLVQISVARGVPTGDLGIRLDAHNPVFVVFTQPRRAQDGPTAGAPL